jgi:tRNA (uracil-5-)-methyltransferase TRM9
MTKISTLYSHIAQHFDETRVAHWKEVKNFILSLPKHALVLDVGCGNGKYANVRSDICYIGTDITPELLQKVPRDRFRASCAVSLPVRERTFDAILHIAVLHHFEDENGRLNILRHLLSLLRPHGHLFITVWAYEQSNCRKRDTKWVRIHPDRTDYLIPWVDKYTNETHMRFYHLFTQQEVQCLLQTLLDEFENIPLQGDIAFDCDNWVIELFT